jgi:ATP-dependent Clp protease ATP-binding subunit ClpA
MSEIGELIPYSRFTKAAQRAIDKAKAAARRSKGEKPGDLLIGLFESSDGLAAKALKHFGIDARILRAQLPKEQEPRLAIEEARRGFAGAIDYARAAKSTHISTPDLLLSLMDNPEGVTARALAAIGIGRQQLEEEIDRLRAQGLHE